ncbi:hypothetical protein BGZ70_008688 [Mortierella alpina]|uniref:Uncharacterized protein n=1 Tax=Mortierella alpina TaxID=64518 RepID=A0A9P6J3B3_MORAP|nr:hypothetical protein BGZ70_008688 [Mortierella alpina]
MVKLYHISLLATLMVTAVVVATPPRHPRIVELEDKMSKGIRLSDEESYELGKLGQFISVRSNPFVKRDSCPNCSKDYQCANLSCDSFCKSCDNCKCGSCGGWFWRTCYCYSNDSDCD